MDHLYKIFQPRNFAGWAKWARQYHQDNHAVQNIKNIYGDMPKKTPQKKVAGFTVAELAKILNATMLSPHPDAMDMRADRNHSANRNCWTQGRISTTAPKDVEQLCKEGCCFTCNKQGHISRNCPDNPPIPNQPTQRSRRTPKPIKLILMMIKLQKRKITGAPKTMPGSIKVKPSQKKRRLPLSIGLSQCKVGSEADF